MPIIIEGITYPAIGGCRNSAALSNISWSQHVSFEQGIDLLSRSYTLSIRGGAKKFPAFELPKWGLLALLTICYKLIEQERMVLQLHLSLYWRSKDERISIKLQLLPEFL